jgi:DNA-binding GntR family transcriptional regulator
MNQPLVRTMSGQLATRIRDKILGGDYAPGTALLQDSIAAEFGVSKIPVREALVRLRAEGLIDIEAHRGFRVRPLSAAEVDEVFRLRLTLEPAAVAIGAKLATEADHASARAALRALDSALAAGALRDIGSFNSAFHLALIVPRAQPVSMEVLSRLHTLSQRYVRMHLAPAGRVRRATREHNTLFNTWAKGDARAARRLTQTHIEETRDELAAFLSAPAGELGKVG